MRLAFHFAALGAFALAAVLSLFMAVFGARQIEQQSVQAVNFAMREDGLDWVEIGADGLRVLMAGTAPDEAARFHALRRAAEIVDTDRIIDNMDVLDPEGIEPPRFSLEMLRNDDGVSLIGLVPTADGDDSLTTGINELADGLHVANMVETAAFPVPAGWAPALRFGLLALAELPRAKVSVYDGQVVVEAVADSRQQRDQWQRFLEENRPSSVQLVLDISAPRPVITPFTLRYVQSAGGGRFESCSAGTEDSRDRILTAARNAGLTGQDSCRIGLGVPSPNWATAAELAIAAVSRFEDATVTFSDADITLIVAQGTSPDLFDEVIGELDAALPEVFSLHAVLPDPPPEEEAEDGLPTFTATRSPEGYVQLRGRLPDERITEAVQAYATALFGRQNTYVATRIDEDLPGGWTLRVMAGLEAMAQLHNGAVVVEPDTVRIRGNSGSESTTSDLSQLMSELLGAAERFEIDVTYVASLDPQTGLLTPQQCLDRINAILDQRKITFDPGSVEINEETGRILDDLAEILPDCSHVDMEIGGHTDSQGREEMNLRLSQGRADAVLNGLLARRVLTANLTAQGYGETRPIADNDSEDGRETNRRIEFLLASDVAERDAREAAEARAQLLADAPRPVMRPDNLVPAAAEEDTE
ncbi:OmpA family protein [Nioella sp.]|uniref:OmpA family protein n=1 Tax=Nioella sp. TaxID=1912091 RepID=UPI003B52AFCD